MLVKMDCANSGGGSALKKEGTFSDGNNLKEIDCGFVPDFINMMKKLGYHYYNEIILINQSGTGAIRAAGNMKSRKEHIINQA